MINYELKGKFGGASVYEGLIGLGRNILLLTTIHHKLVYH